MFKFLKKIFSKKPKKENNIDLQMLALQEQEKANIRAFNMRECKRKA